MVDALAFMPSNCNQAGRGAGNMRGNRDYPPDMRAFTYNDLKAEVRPPQHLPMS
jgi:hypothetical protein